MAAAPLVWRVVTAFVMKPPGPALRVAASGSHSAGDAMADASSSTLDEIGVLPTAGDGARDAAADPRTDATFLLGQRAATMPTFAGRWAGISGTVEAGETPLEAAWRELSEEVSLTGDDLSLQWCGLPVDVLDVRTVPPSGAKASAVSSDDSGARRDAHADDSRASDSGSGSGSGTRSRIFRVHPFLFQRVSDAVPSLCSEHSRMVWATAEQVRGLELAGETVPALWEALTRVWDPPRWAACIDAAYKGSPRDASLVAGARAIHADRDLGAAELARQAAALVGNGADPEAVASLRPTMVAVTNAARAAGGIPLSGRPVTIVDGARVAASTDVARTPPAALADKVLDELSTATAAAAEATARALSELASGTIVATISRSSTLLAALAHDITPPLHVLVSESLPGAEGHATAAALSPAVSSAQEASVDVKYARRGHKVTVVDDAELVERVRRGDAAVVLLGGDCVTQSGDLVNKVGSRALAQAASEARACGHGGDTENRVPVWAAVDRWKVSHDTVPPALEADLFELVPSALVTRLLGCGDALQQAQDEAKRE